MKVFCKGTAEQVRQVAEFARFLRKNFPEHCADNFELHCEYYTGGYRGYTYKGWAYPRIGWKAQKFAKRFGREISKSSRYYAWVGICSDPKVWPRDAHYRKNVPQFKYQNANEAMLSVMAHELHHLYEFATGKNERGPEPRCIRMEYRVLTAYRVEKANEVLKKLVESCRVELAEAAKRDCNKDTTIL